MHVIPSLKELPEIEIYPAHIAGDRVQDCRVHCLNTARYAEDDLKTTGLETAAYLGGILHDCGKFTEEFRDYLIKAVNGEPMRKGSVIHSFAGVYWLLKEHAAQLSHSLYAALTAELMVSRRLTILKDH